MSKTPHKRYNNDHCRFFTRRQSHRHILRGISERVKRNRLELNLTQKALAARSGVSFGSLRKFETTGEISLKSLVKIAIALDATDAFADLRAEQQLPTTMQQWIEFMNGYLQLNNLPVLKGLGKKTKEQADEKALTEYAEFRIIQDRNYIGDFEKMMLEVEKTKIK